MNSNYEELFKEGVVIKFNGGLLALLCSKCRVIIRTGISLTEKEKRYLKGEIKWLPPAFCHKCLGLR